VIDHANDAFVESPYRDERGEGIAAFLDKRAPRVVRRPRRDCP
jgi:hypothetical protein